MLLYGATLFLSAFLLFLIQPLIGKYVLPWFGGTPAIWTTCMLFFQALLLAGYAYAHALASRKSLLRQAWVHICLAAATVLTVLWFTVVPSQAWRPAGGSSPVLGILGLLAASIGAPFFLLSSTAPLLQFWFSSTHPGSPPYRLYALSNLGSLLALLSYPFLIEPALRLGRQASIWSLAYCLFGGAVILVSLQLFKSGGRAILPGQAESAISAPDKPGPGPGRYALWLGLTVCSSVMLLATTGMLCQDLAVVPLLWILPLAIYLLSFVICFQHERLYWRPLFIGGLAASIAWTCEVLYGSVWVALRWQILSYSLTLLATCMVCHGELVRLKPAPRYLTSFYLMVAGGGALGGLLVTVAAPHLLKGFWEYHFGILLTTLLALLVLFIERKGLLHQGGPAAVWTLWGVLCVSWAVLATRLADRVWTSWRFYVGAAGVVLATLAVWLIDRERRSYRGRPARVWAVWCGLCASWVVLALVLANHMREAGQGSVETARNFFGVLRVKELYPEDPTEHRYSLVHGRIEHGFQYLDGERRFWHVSYYGPDSGIGLALDRYPGRLQGGNLRIGVIGLGTGTLAVYGQPGDYIRFYEINPDVVRLSDKYFSYRRDSRARTEIVLGDARISMERERQQGEAQEFDVLAVDAFNSDAIPVHLLTRECFLTYCYHLKTNGILAFHITNRYFDLKPVIRSLLTVAPNVDTHAIWIHDTGGGNLGTDRTDWVLVTANREFLADAEVRRRMTPWTDSERPGLMWTDDYSNLFGLLNERGNND